LTHAGAIGLPHLQAQPPIFEKYYTDRLTISRGATIFNLMVDNHSPELDAVFRALSDPTRRAMLAHLSREPHKVGELAAPFAITLAAASKHIKVLERAGLVQRSVEGRTHTCRLDARPMHNGFEWMRHYERFWNQRLDVLEALLEAEDAAAKGGEPVGNGTSGNEPTLRKRKPK
jgi:DNA-binding transcriptional ArsR family regulator